MFVNFSNHPSEKWSETQLEAAREYGEIVDLAFPNVRPEAGEDDVNALAEEYYEKIMKYAPAAVMCQGEFTLTYAIVRRLLSVGVCVLTACSERVVEERNGQKISVFQFVRFRRYE